VTVQGTYFFVLFQPNEAFARIISMTEECDKEGIEKVLKCRWDSLKGFKFGKTGDYCLLYNPSAKEDENKLIYEMFTPEEKEKIAPVLGNVLLGTQEKDDFESIHEDWSKEWILAYEMPTGVNHKYIPATYTPSEELGLTQTSFNRRDAKELIHDTEEADKRKAFLKKFEAKPNIPTQFSRPPFGESKVEERSSQSIGTKRKIETVSEQEQKRRKIGDFVFNKDDYFISPTSHLQLQVEKIPQFVIVSASPVTIHAERFLAKMKNMGYNCVIKEQGDAPFTDKTLGFTLFFPDQNDSGLISRVLNALVEYQEMISKGK